MKQEPVAYITKSCKCYSTPLKALESNEKEALIPVYTEPQYRELSDEEIEQVAYECRSKGKFANEFAKSILRKAQEK